MRPASRLNPSRAAIGRILRPGKAAQVPTANNVVLIHPDHTVTITNTSAVAYTVAIDGMLRFAPTLNTRLTVTNLQVMAGADGMGAPGVLEVGTVANPIAPTVTAEIVIANTPLGGGVADPIQFGTGIIVFGKIVDARQRADADLRAPRGRAACRRNDVDRCPSRCRDGESAIASCSPTPGTSRKPRSPAAAGSMPSTSGKSARCRPCLQTAGRSRSNAPLLYDHLGARDFDGVLEFLPHIGNLTRNVIVRSANPTGTRGHMAGIHMADMDIRYALFQDLGRTTFRPLNTTTNHIGRYPIHMHHVSGPLATPANGYQFTLMGNAVDGGSVGDAIQVGHRRPWQPLRPHPGQRRLQLQRRRDRDRGRLRKLQRLRPQLRAQGHGRARPTAVRSRRVRRWAPRASGSGSEGRTTS